MQSERNLISNQTMLLFTGGSLFIYLFFKMCLTHVQLRTVAKMPLEFRLQMVINIIFQSVLALVFEAWQL